MPYTALTRQEVDDCKGEAKKLVDLANRQRLSLHKSPSQSFFKVVALFLVQADDGLHLVEGYNAEQGYLGGAICAERAAMVQLRKLANPSIQKVVITTDSDEPISPGILCREYMMSLADSEMPVVLGNASGDQIAEFQLGQIHPAPYAYRKQDRAQVLPFATGFAQLCQGQQKGGTKEEGAWWSVEDRELYVQARGAVDATTRTTSMHPINFAAAVRWQGQVEVGGWLPALEYGGTLCPVQMLLREFEKRRLQHGDEGEGECTLVMVDNLGVAHAPFASARALLGEYGYGRTRVLYHSEEGKECSALLQELTPPPPGGAFLTHDAFN